MQYSVRMQAAVRAALTHGLICLGIAALVAMLVFGLWFPGSYGELAGGLELFWLVILVDVVCGPVLTLVLFNPAKPRKELFLDIGLVVVLQLLALGLGLHTLKEARPAVLAFEIDRFRVVSFADLDESDMQNAPDWLRSWSFSAPRPVATFKSKDPDEQLKDLDYGLANLDLGQRPSRWQPYQLNLAAVIEAAKPLKALAALHPTQENLIEAAVAKTKQTADTLVWLPVISRKTNDWVVLIDKETAEIKGFIHLDGFDPG